MTPADALGWAACLMTFVTFAQQRMVPLRCAAILANLFFIGYAALGHYLPVLVLHLTLLPVNARRLFSLLAYLPGDRTAAVTAEAVPQMERDGPGLISWCMPKGLQNLIDRAITFGGPR